MDINKEDKISNIGEPSTAKDLTSWVKY